MELQLYKEETMTLVDKRNARHSSYSSLNMQDSESTLKIRLTCNMNFSKVNN